MVAKREYAAQAEARLMALDTLVNALEGRIEGVEGEPRVEYNADILALRAQERQAAARIEGLRAAGDGGWEKLKPGLNESLGELEDYVTWVRAKLE